jgi:hypothetical protein
VAVCACFSEVASCVFPALPFPNSTIIGWDEVVVELLHKFSSWVSKASHVISWGDLKCRDVIHLNVVSKN